MNASTECDVVIIGSGVAGALCACRLAEQGVRVRLIEAGPWIERASIVQGFEQTADNDLSAGYPNPDWAPRPNWNPSARPYIEHLGTVHPALEYLRVVGGTTWHWSGSAMRMRPEDFRLYSEYQRGVDWPLRYEDLEPDYLSAEHEMGVAGEASADPGLPRSAPFPMPPVPPSYAEIRISAGLKQLGYKLLPRPAARNTRSYDGRRQCVGYGTCTPVCPSGAQYAAIVHVKKAQSLGVEVLAEHRVEQLVAGADGKIHALRFTRSDGSRGEIRARLFVVAANGIETPRLLLMSANEHFPAGLANRSGQVGRNFMDHPGLLMQLRLPEAVFSGRGPNSTLYGSKHAAGTHRRHQPAWILSTQNSLDLHELTRTALTEGHMPPQLDQIIRTRAAHSFLLDTQIEQLPDPDNRITLDWKQRDSAGLPRIQLHYRYNAYEQAGFVHVRAQFEKMAVALNAQSHEILGPFSHHHLMGTARMGSDPSQSVTDLDGRTHDHNNLFILGSAVFPTGGTANPTLTIAALSLRAARAILAQLQTGQ
ncbi:MAG: GMC family oxidoreductase [Thiobacillus sp.]